jgi:hypothetical protein
MSLFFADFPLALPEYERKDQLWFTGLAPVWGSSCELEAISYKRKVTGKLQTAKNSHNSVLTAACGLWLAAGT